MTKRADQLLREAAQFLAAADQKQAKADADKWAAAERMWKANKEEGATIREIAAVLIIGKSTADRHIRIWTLHGVPREGQDLPSFTDCYYEVQGHTPADREEQAVERVLRERPEVVAQKISQNSQAAKAIAEHAGARVAISRAADAHDVEIGRRAADKFAEAVGQETVDGLEAEQRLRDAEAKLFEARRALRDMLALLHESDMEDLRDSWREDFLKTLDDVAMRVDVARSMLGGTLDADLDRFLAEV